MVEGLSFHHVGVACRDLDRETALFNAIGYRADGTDFADPTQGVFGRFLVGAGPRLELLVSSGGGGVLEPWLRAGAKLYHLAFLATDLGEGVQALREQKGKVVVAPVPAVAFEGRSIAFVMLPNLLLIELIQAPPLATAVEGAGQARS